MFSHLLLMNSEILKVFVYPAAPLVVVHLVFQQQSTCHVPAEQGQVDSIIKEG